MKTKKKKVKVKNSKVEQTITQYQNFLWTLTSQEAKGPKKTVLTFKRGPVEVVDRKGKKQVKKFEKAYVQISKKKVPVAFIILALLTVGCFIPTFVIQDLEDIFKVVCYSIGSVFGVCALFTLIIYIVTMCRKKSLKKRCIEKAQFYNAKLPGEEDPGQHLDEPID